MISASNKYEYFSRLKGQEDE